MSELDEKNGIQNETEENVVNGEGQENLEPAETTGTSSEKDESSDQKNGNNPLDDWENEFESEESDEIADTSKKTESETGTTEDLSGDDKSKKPENGASEDETPPAEGEEKLFAGKYKSIEDLEKGYTELLKMYSQNIGTLEDSILKGQQTEQRKTEVAAEAETQSAVNDVIGDSLDFLEPDEKTKIIDNITNEVQRRLLPQISPIIQEYEGQKVESVLNKFRGDNENYPNFSDYEKEMTEFVVENPQLVRMFTDKGGNTDYARVADFSYNYIRSKKGGISELRTKIAEEEQRKFLEEKTKLEKEFNDKLQNLALRKKASPQISKKTNPVVKSQEDPLTEWENS